MLNFHDEDQRARMKARAALNHRTLNAEILFLIERGQEAVDAKENARPVAASQALVTQ